MRKILNNPIGIDDLVNELYECHFTKSVVTINNFIYLGARA